jgi:methanogenic corrinoid protein MtbC1
MADLNQGLVDPGEEGQALDEAISAFLYLGERLSSARDADRERTATAASAPMPIDAAESLFRAIEGEIIPRLMLAHQPQPQPHASERRRPPESALSPEDHARFLEGVLRDSAAATHAFVEELLQRGVPREAIFLDLLANAARRLGELWEEDLCDFSDVTIGLCRLHEVLRTQASFSTAEGERAALDAPRVLLGNACADQHVFGIVMVGEFFRRAGWRVSSEPGASCSQLSGILASESFDLLGISAACSAPVDDVASELAHLRKASRNRQLRVLVGGRLFMESPELAERVGADGIALDARSAPIAARGLLARAANHC